MVSENLLIVDDLRPLPCFQMPLAIAAAAISLHVIILLITIQ
jgi:hypothetical protein